MRAIASALGRQVTSSMLQENTETISIVGPGMHIYLFHKQAPYLIKTIFQSKHRLSDSFICESK